MPREIEYFFSMASPWSYLGHAAFQEIAASHGLRVAYRPVALGALFPETGGLPLARRHPARQQYRLVELQRWRDRRGLPLVTRPRHTPFDPSLLDRAVIALAASGHSPDAFMRRAFAAVWAEERNLEDAAVVAEVATSCGLDAASLLDRAGRAEATGEYAENLQAALAAGVFGAPSWVLDGEVFWGQDRLDLLDEALRSGRAPYTPG
ncbi:2-hydroxychromene-2-carboxylate isomerase [Arenibaculum pallidiluteum]|uniref:2-hydroxychromene-2-carboxylate isomerase n=1 Tax=Arenibaculum pallidiluteum TaxID=2812559 RepID=UPI001A95AD67|nr:2-hydroxychromene-2-carboxylate isomerase [Arenibaculum pallidiluteum]